MATLLRIDASSRGDYSVSKTLGNHFTAKWQAKNGGGKVISHDVTQERLPFVDLPWLGGAFTPAEQHSIDQKTAIQVSDDLVAEVFEADEILITTPMYNFSIPAALKAWIDHIVRLGKTFDSSFQGLVKGKKATIIMASGSVYTPGAQLESYNVATAYLKQILAFIGITDTTVILAGGSSAVDQGKTTLTEFVEPFDAEVIAAAK